MGIYISEEGRRIPGQLCSSLLNNLQCSNLAASNKGRSVRLPSASELRKANISFTATLGNISVIKYKHRKRRLHLPLIIVDDETEDVLMVNRFYDSS